MKRAETALMVTRALKGGSLKIYVLRNTSGTVFLVVETSKAKAINCLACALASDPKLGCFCREGKPTCECLGLAKTGLAPGLVESALDSLYFVCTDK